MAEPPSSPHQPGNKMDNRLQSPPPGPQPPKALEKERRDPSITPRKFRKFFTPRQSSKVSTQPSAARRALREMTAGALNRAQTPSSPLKPRFLADSPDRRVDSQTPPKSKRRKLGHSPDSSPSRPYPFSSGKTSASTAKSRAEATLLSPTNSVQSSRLSPAISDDEDEDEDVDEDVDMDVGDEPIFAKRISPVTRRGFAGQLVQRQLGDMPRAGRHFMSNPVADWRTETADFCSTKDDLHMCANQGRSGKCIPFCTAACHTNSMVAIGDEEGFVRLLDSGSSEQGRPSDLRKHHVAFRAHGNALIDLAFSPDDSLLATASGDQTGKVFDMMTQTTVSILGHHSASLKQVRFQPGRGQGSVLATSSRDGSVQIWDLRCKGPPVQNIDPVDRARSLEFRIPRKLTQGCVVNSLYGAHARTQRQTKMQGHTTSADVATRSEVPGRLGEVSVTAIHFLPPGREHLLLTGCESDASIKLWDIRNLHTSRNKTATPISFTAPPDSHTQWRPFGIGSLALSTDSSRLYAACKDNTVYAYSTAHLVLGHAPELSNTKNGDPPRRRNGTAQEGLGPIYGLRHDSFHAASFYVKSALRPARDGQSELLAVGSSDGCAVLFPTDERYLQQHFSAANVDPAATISSSSSTAAHPPGLFRANSSSLPGGGSGNSRATDTIPIVRNVGTALTRGHNKEVGALSWTHEGKLITAADDYLVRRWSEDRVRAADLRTGGETGGRRWASGWADVGPDWDLNGDDEW